MRSYFWARNEIVFEIFHSFFLMNKKSNDSINKFSITLTRYVRSVTYSSLVSIPSSVTCSSRINLIFCAVCAVKLLVIRVNGWKQQKLHKNTKYHQKRDVKWGENKHLILFIHIMIFWIYSYWRNCKSFDQIYLKLLSE